MSAEHDTEAAESARRIVEYWAARGVKDPSDCKARHLDELRVALSLLSRVETAREEMKEECAKCCERIGQQWRDGTGAVQHSHAADFLARSIRSLSTRIK